ncbi:hypothetical protein CPAR01_14657 [Colletotrichum paranaense]|uniref:Uncharacterized protein n=2 Tax=Colletotrichum acutatum species complex TaxID=2707335 RepID=A0AAI9U8F2_9PEZI|nr:uncharacterized protein CPAR01_14657 [Colletotrichum paranaense]KAK1451710.1 hypothetical protein CMEL01_06284 [Colletotrichum melonis]KAK1521740.1 hypothetical protein CPAR01_14657 [Colletotrichum paranaense]
MSLALAHTPLAACLRSARAFALTPCARNSLARPHLRLHPLPSAPKQKSALVPHLIHAPLFSTPFWCVAITPPHPP